MKKILLVLFLFFVSSGIVFAYDFDEKKDTHFIVYYKDVPVDFVDKILEFSERYYNELINKLGFTRFNYWTWDHRAKIYIYPDQETYAAQTKQPAWSGGAAAYEKKTIWTYPRGAGFFDSTLPHEIGHIIFKEVIGYRSVPLWLEEGVASYLEEAKRFGSEKSVLDALKNNTFIPLDDLAKIDGSDLRQGDNVELFYAEAVSVVNYLIDKFGVDSFNTFCEKLKDGKKLDDALSFAYFDIRSSKNLGELWENYLRDKAQVKVRTML